MAFVVVDQSQSMKWEVLKTTLLKDQNGSDNDNNTRTSDNTVDLTEDLIASAYSYSPSLSKEDRARKKSGDTDL